MSDSRPFFHGWRARAHYLTRNRHFLLRTAVVIIALGMIAACTLVVVRQHGGELAQDRAHARVDRAADDGVGDDEQLQHAQHVGGDCDVLRDHG
jgi:hypothetical protein